MSCTIPLSRTINLTQQFVRNAPLTFAANNGVPATNDPAFSNADWVRQFILAPPFAWPWNRNKASITCKVGIQDYTLALSSFGWLEKAVIFDPNGAATHELEVVLDLAEETVPNQPTQISTQSDDNQGNITFRLTPPPDQTYQVEVTYQSAVGLFQNLTDKWTPIPDKLSYLFNQGMLAKTYEYLDDSRFGLGMQLFLRQVLAANTGLDDTQRDIFISNVINTQRDTQSQLQSSQQGRQARGAF